MSEHAIVQDEKQTKFYFRTCFLKEVDILLTSYQTALDQLSKMSIKPDGYITDAYGICNNNYKMRYVTPYDVSTFVSYFTRLINDGPYGVENVNDMETMAVAMIQRFVNDNKNCTPFESTNAYGNNAYIDQRTITLSKLLVMCRNEFYDTNVYSLGDMKNRAIAIKPDVTLLRSINFSANMRKLIVGIPKILNENCFPIAQVPRFQKLAQDIISRFIRTVCLINLITVEQLMAYCIPTATYNVKMMNRNNYNTRLDYDYYKESDSIVITKSIDDESKYMIPMSDGIVSETVNLKRCKPVFISLSTGGNNPISKAIKKATNEEYSHSSISFDPNMDKMYTFNAAIYHDDKYNWQLPGLQYEALHSSKYNDVRVTVYCVFVSNETYDKMKSIAENMAKSGAKYDYKAIFSRWHALRHGGADANPSRTDNKNRQICSSFVNSLLSVAGDPIASKEIISPGEIGKAAAVRSSEVFKIFDGVGANYNADEALMKIRKIAEKENASVYAKTIAESMYTECCLLKTNEMRINSKIPFNCNMRDVVLQDMHPEFKDTESAIMFMVSDERSPITSLLRKYRTIEKIQPNARILNMFMHLRHAYGNDFDTFKANKLQNSIGMHTDVNWLDKITYGNQFLDGNYRADALGNNKFNPMENTLCHLYSMYNCEAMKNNEELANNIIEVANAMHGVIRGYNDKIDGCAYNWEMVRDILAVLGEILTRSMLKLYHNNTIVLSVTDDMPDTGSAGYMYIESFDMFLEADDSVKVSVNSNKTGAAKVFGNIRMLIQKFLNWISRVWSNIVNKFSTDHGAELKWIENHKQLNEDIGKAFNNGFDVTLNNYVPYQLQIQKITDKKIKTLDIIKEFTDKGETPSVDQMFAKMMEKLEWNKTENNGTPPDAKTLQLQLKNYLLYNMPERKAQQAQTKLDQKTWNSIVDDLINTPTAMKKVVDEMKKDMEETAKFIDQTNKKTTNESYEFDYDGNMFMEGDTPPKEGTNTDGNGEGETASKTNWSTVATNFTKFTAMFENSVINTIQKDFYGAQYKMYRDIVSAYQSQYEKPNDNTEQQQKTEEKPAEQQSEQPAEQPAVDNAGG